MTAGDPELLAQGRAADVFDLGDGTVLRRHRIDHDTEREAEAMAWADLVMGLVPVPTMTFEVGDRLGRSAFLAVFRGRRGRARVARYRREAARRRLADANVTPGERAALQRMVR